MLFVHLLYIIHYYKLLYVICVIHYYTIYILYIIIRYLYIFRCELDDSQVVMGSVNDLYSIFFLISPKFKNKRLPGDMTNMNIITFYEYNFRFLISICINPFILIYFTLNIPYINKYEFKYTSI